MSASPPSEPDDFALMARVRLEDSEAFRQIVERHQRPLLNFFYRMGASTCSEDLAQETLVQLWKYRKKYRPKAKFTTFLYTLARHVWLDFLRKKLRFQEAADRFQKQSISHSDGGIPSLRRHLDMQTALDSLSERLREVLVLAVYQGLTYQEIAKTLSIPEGTVKSRIYNAMNYIRNNFDEK